MDKLLSFDNGPRECVVDYLRQIVQLNKRQGPATIPYYGAADVILQHARVWSSADVSGRRHEGKQCFANCQRIATSHPGMIYVEGYALSIIPVHHAWLVDSATGHVVDPTWQTAGSAYVGVPIRTRYLRQLHLRTGYYTAVFDNWADSNPQPILTGHHTLSEWLQSPFEFGEPIPC